MARTREELAELRRAGVVDAGGKGMLLFFDALHAAVTRSGRTEAVGPMGPVGNSGLDGRVSYRTEFKFEVQYLLDADDARLPPLRRELAEIGDSLVVVGGDGTYKVHVHTNDPERAVELAAAVGTASSRRCACGRSRIWTLRATSSPSCSRTFRLSSLTCGLIRSVMFSTRRMA